MPTVDTTQVTLTSDEIAMAIRQLTSNNRLLFQNRHNRDAVYKALPAHQKLTARRGSIKNQLLDPRYTFEGSNITDSGLGNDYRHHFAAVYELAV